MAPSPAATTTPGEDVALMQRVQQGDEGAFAILLQRWERPVKSVIARLVLNAGETEDLAQETFVRVWQQRAKFRREAEFRPWVFSIAVNLARNRLRWWRRRPHVALDSWTEAEESGAKVGGAMSAASAELERVELAAAVREAVAALPTDLREVVVLFEYEGLSHAEIAAALGCTPKAVEARLYRAREKLRKALSAERPA